MPAEDLIFRVGETRRISHVVSADDAFPVTAVLFYLYDSAGTVSVNGGTGVVDDPSSGVEHEVYYLWTPAAAGDYTYRFLATVGGQTVALPQDGFGTVTVLPATSKYDRYVAQVRSHLQDAAVVDAEGLLSYRDLMRATDEAVRAYERVHPRRIVKELTLAADDWEYALTELSGWITGVSQVLSLEYPVDATRQAKGLYSPSEIVVEQYLATPTFRFASIVPSTGQTARVLYDGGYTLSHTVDDLATYAPRDYEGVCLLAASFALRRLQTKTAGTTGQGIGAEVVNYRTQSQEWGAAAKEFERLAWASLRRQAWAL